MKVLIIEDEKTIADLLKTGLEKEGYSTDCVYDGLTGQTRIELYHKDYDLIILDVMLPGKDGFEICRDVREKKIDTPIIILTAKNYVDDKVSGLDCGADDYLTKPFELKELLAHMRAILRRPKQSLATELKIRNIVLNPAKRVVLRSGKPIKLTLKEFGLLEYLMRHPDKVVTRDDLIFNIWDFNSDSFSNFVDVHMNSLRNKINKSGDKSLIQTVRGVGYIINS